MMFSMNEPVMFLRDGQAQRAKVITLPRPSTARIYVVLAESGRAYEAEADELVARPIGGGEMEVANE